MNIRPVAQGTGTPGASEGTIGSSASPERVARAKAVAAGKTVSEAPAHQDPQVDRAEASIKRIKMRTQRSVFRDLPPEQTELAPQDAANNPESNIPDPSVQAEPVTEENKPLSPQFAALAKAKRALQEDRRAFEAEKKAIGQNQGFNAADYVSKADLLARPLSVVRELGVTDKLTEEILSESQEQSPALNKLEAEIKALKEGLENQNKTQTDRDEAQKQQVLAQMERDAAQIIAQGDEYEMVRETGSIKDVIRLIDKTYSTTGEVLDVDDALKLVEDELFNESLKIANIKKVKSKLTPAPIQQTQQQIQKPNVRVMRTLTNRDGASVPSSPRERAIAAFYGRKS